MRLAQVVRAAAIGAMVLCFAGCSGGGVLLGVGTVLQSPFSAYHAAVRLFTERADNPSAPMASATPSPPPVSTPSEAVTSVTPAPTAPPDVTGLLGAIALIPDTGAPEGTGGVIEQHYPNGSGDAYIPLAAGTLRNMTSVPNAEVETAIAAGLPFTIERNSDAPQVLIMHTHATETYRPYEGLYYDLDGTARTTEKSQSVCAVGEIITKTLNDAGIYTLHDTTLNDYPSYNASYGNSHEVVADYLAQYPSIKVVIDVHRDALQDESHWYAPISEIDGAQSAQVMIIAGCDNGGSITLPHCMENLAFAAAWQAEMEGSAPGLTRSAMFKYKYYNQDLTTGSLLLEVGGHGNTLNEALYAGQLAAQSLVRVLVGQE